MKPLEKIVFLDTETTGLLAHKHEIWEVALVLRRPDQEDEAHIWQLPLLRPHDADPIALDIGHFDDRRWESHRLTDHKDFASQFMLLTNGSTLIGNIVSFDEERLRRLFLETLGLDSVGWHYHIRDIESLIAGYLLGITDSQDDFRGDNETRLKIRRIAKGDWNSRELSETIGISPDDFERHTAMGDVNWVIAQYEAICDGVMYD